MRFVVCLLFVTFLLLSSGEVFAGTSKDCTNCPNNGKCAAAPLPAKSVLDNRILKLIPDKKKVEVTTDGGVYIFEKKNGGWTTTTRTCEGGTCTTRQWRLFPLKPKVEPQPTVAPAKKVTKVVTVEKRKTWRNRAGRRGWFRFWGRVQMRRSAGCCN